MPITSSTGIFGNTYAFINDKSPIYHRLRVLFKRRGTAPIAAQVEEILDNDGVGSNPGVTRARVQYAADPGGARDIETQNVANANTTSDNADEFRAIINRTAAITYPGDASGNGK